MLRKVVFGFFCFSMVTTSFAATKPLPADLQKVISEKHVSMSVVASGSCDLGPSKIKSYGFILQAKTLTNKDKSLAPVVAFLQGKQWKLAEVTRSIDYSSGGDPDFLHDFWEEKKGLKLPYSIKCVNPKKDSEISPKANGEFLGTFKSPSAARGKQVCFQASDVYNSWSCFGFDGGRIKPSFAQMNAD